MLSQILPVSTLNAYIQQVLNADDILADLWVEGEITSITYAKSGHIYFKLCDEDALIDGAMWRTFATRQAVRPRVGDAVIVHGRIDYYSPQGRLQVIADVFEHQGQGILALEIERLRQQLESEGLFDPSRKRPLPRFPRRVGVVTSNTGAVWHDIQTVARRRFPLVELVLIPAAVQGSGAPAQIVAAIEQMCSLESIDVMIVGRGGGSPEDLAPFNHESVARAIYASSVPVVSAVGHETDVSIADMVADVRAATPSAAAEIILPDMQELLTDLDDYRSTMIDLMERRLADGRTTLDRIQRRLVLQSPALRIERTQHELSVLRHRLANAGRGDVRRRQNDLANTAKLLDALHPVRVMQRGYAMVETADGTLVSRIADLPSDGIVIVNFRDGAAEGSLQPVDSPTTSPRSESEHA